MAFPDRDGVPAHVGQFALDFTVALLVAGDLPDPEFTIGVGNLATLAVGDAIQVKVQGE